MGKAVGAEPAGPGETHESLLRAFARRLRQRYGARTYLFGSYARGTARPDSDYDVVAVAEAFAGQHPLDRALDRGQLWREAGGWGIALDLQCYTPDEFRRQLQAGGYLAMARARGELREIRPLPETRGLPTVTASPEYSPPGGRRPSLP